MFAKVIMIGRLGQDPKLSYTKDGTPYVNFGVACTKNYRKNNGEKAEETTWFQVSCWRKLAEIAAQYLNKGDKCYIEGEPKIEEYKDRNGELKTSFKILANEITFIETKKKENRQIDPSVDNPYSDMKNVIIKNELSELDSNDLINDTMPF